MSEMPQKFLSLDLKARSIREHYKKAMSEAHKKIAQRWVENGANITVKNETEILFPNNKNKANPYSVDIILPEYLTLIEIDGYQHESMRERDNIRDVHILEIAHNTGVDWRLKRLPLAIPKNLLYGQLQGIKREQVKAEYISWLNKLADDSLAMIKQEYLARRLEKLKNN